MENENEPTFNYTLGIILIALGLRVLMLYGDLLTPIALSIFGLSVIFFEFNKNNGV